MSNFTYQLPIEEGFDDRIKISNKELDAIEAELRSFKPEIFDDMAKRGSVDITIRMGNTEVEITIDKEMDKDRKGKVHYISTGSIITRVKKKVVEKPLWKGDWISNSFDPKVTDGVKNIRDLLAKIKREI